MPSTFFRRWGMGRCDWLELTDIFPNPNPTFIIPLTHYGVRYELWYKVRIPESCGLPRSTQVPVVGVCTMDVRPAHLFRARNHRCSVHMNHRPRSMTQPSMNHIVTPFRHSRLDIPSSRF